MELKEYNQRLNTIKNASLENLRNKDILEELIIPNLGLANHAHNQWPEKLHKHFGGIELWQYPNQLSKLLFWLSDRQIKSFVEIGTFKGGTFITLFEYLKRFNQISEALTVDTCNNLRIPNEYIENNKNILKFIVNNEGSRSANFKEIIKDKTFDMAFIDGAHDAVNMSKDYLLLQDKCRILIFHDISFICKSGWERIKLYNKQNKFNVLEITDQYNYDKKCDYMGYGILYL